jgi:xylulokinase
VAACRELSLDDVDAISVDGQGHGLVVLDADGEVIRPAKLWNDTTSSAEAEELVGRLGREAWASRTGIVPVAAITISKLLWLKRHEPSNFARVATVLLPPDYLTYRLTGNFVTDRSEASGTGYYDAARSTWALDLLALIDDRVDWLPRLPRIAGPNECAGRVTRGAADAAGIPEGALVGPGANDQPVNALSLGLRDEDVLISLGTSGTVSARSTVPTADPTAAVTGVADATGAYAPLACTLNATKVTDTFAQFLGVDLSSLAELALAAPPDADRPVLIPYLDGERTPSRPRGTGVLVGLRPGATREQLARAAFEGVLCGLLEAHDTMRRLHVPMDGRVVLTGGGSNSRAYRQFLADLIGRPVYVSELAETSASGAAIQAAAVLHNRPVEEVVRAWAPPLRVAAEPRLDQHVFEVRERYRRYAAIDELDS